MYNTISKQKLISSGEKQQGSSEFQVLSIPQKFGESLKCTGMSSLTCSDFSTTTNLATAMLIYNISHKPYGIYVARYVRGLPHTHIQFYEVETP